MNWLRPDGGVVGASGASGGAGDNQGGSGHLHGSGGVFTIDAGSINAGGAGGSFQTIIWRPDGSHPGDVYVPDQGAPASLPLIWSDEFNGRAHSSIDDAKWTFATADPGPTRRQLQKYVNGLDNASLDGKGHLVIRSLPNPNGTGYTSARIESRGPDGLAVGPGHRIEVNAKLPSGIGTVAGISMLGTGGAWPLSGELTLVEQWGQEKNWFYVFALADSTTNGSTGRVRFDFPNAATASTDFHRYAVDWYVDQIVFSVDDQPIVSRPFTADGPLASKSEYLALSMAVGGDMGGSPNLHDYPAEMTIDYVRVFKLK